MSNFLTSIPAFIFGIAILIAVHEFGHYWVAKKLGIKIQRFSIGFGKALYRKRFGADNTEFVVAAIPLGGYVKMLDEREGPVADEEKARAYNNQSILTRAAVLVAGPGFNFLFAILAFVFLLSLGESGIRPQIDSVAEKTISAQAGLRAGDEILAVGDQTTPTWEAAIIALMSGAVSGDELPLRVRGDDGRERGLSLQLQGIDQLTRRGEILNNLGISQRRRPLPAVIGELTAGQPAQQAGLRANDEVLAINGQGIGDWVQMVETIRDAPGQDLLLTLRRDGVDLEKTVRPLAHRLPEGNIIGRIGASMAPPPPVPDDMRVTVRHAPWNALGEAVVRTWDLSALTLRLLGKMVVGEASLKQNLAGPLTIAATAGRTAQAGYEPYLKLLALISVSLGVLNLLPIPILDGGHLALLVVEAVRRRPLSEAGEALGQKLGMVLLLTLMSLAFYVDLERLFTGAL